MWGDDFEERELKLSSEKEKKLLSGFLEKQGLTLDRDLEYAMAVLSHGKIIATGSFSNRVLKCIAVDDEYKNTGLSARVITHLTNEQYKRGRTHFFIFTKPENKKIFSELGLSLVAEVPGKVVLMENYSDGLKRYLDELVSESGEIVPSAAVVVNCNPFTLGHQYLLEVAAARCQKLHVFVVWEDRSSFPAEVRYRLVKEGTAHLPNVVIHKGKDYIISDATFPTYFIKQYEDITDTHARLDITIFARHIAKRLLIQKRFVGEEPFCAVTAAYNKVMSEMLPAYGIELEIIPRKTADGAAISASRVRELIRSGEMQAAQELVPETTYRFLLSEGAQDIIENIRSSSGRH